MDINILGVGKEIEKQLDEGGKELDRAKRRARLPWWVSSLESAFHSRGH